MGIVSISAHFMHMKQQHDEFDVRLHIPCIVVHEALIFESILQGR